MVANSHMWLFKLKLITLDELKTAFPQLHWTHFYALQSHMTSGYHSEPCRYRTFLLQQKVLLDSTAQEYQILDAVQICICMYSHAFMHRHSLHANKQLFDSNNEMLKYLVHCGAMLTYFWLQQNCITELETLPLLEYMNNNAVP